MRRLPVLLSLATLMACAPPAAASYGVVPFRALGGSVTCARPSGEPGGIAFAFNDTVGLARPTATGISAGSVVRLTTKPTSCPVVALRSGGAGIAVQAGLDGKAAVIRAALRGPGGAFMAPRTIARLDGSPGELAAAIAPDGAAVVAVVDQTSVAGPAVAERQRLLAVRRPAGAPFGAVEQVSPWRTARLSAPRLVAGIDDAGTATIATAPGVVASAQPKVALTSAAAGASFPAPAVLESTSGFDLAVAPDGRALLANATNDHVHVFEREPGAASFGAPRTLAASTETEFHMPAVALKPDGSAIVAWDGDQGRTSTVALAGRPAPGAFGPVRQAPGIAASSATGFFSAFAGPGVFDGDGPRLRAVAGPGDDFAVTWGGRDGTLAAPRPHVWTGRLATEPGEAAATADLVRSPGSIAPVAGPDGLGVVWSDGSGGILGGETFGTGQGRLHGALAGAPAAAGASAPAVTIRPPARQRRYPDDSVSLRLRCAAACDVSGVVDVGLFHTGVSVSRGSAGPVSLEFELSGVFLKTRYGRFSVPVRLRVSAPAGAQVATRRVTLPVDVVRPPKVSAPYDVRAVRDGRDVIVTFRSRGPATAFVVLALRPGTPSIVNTVGVKAKGRHRFRVRVPYATRARSIVISAVGPGGGSASTRHIRIRG